MRYLTHNTALLTQDFIMSTEWDIIELDLEIDPVQLDEYYTVLKTKLNHLCFNFASEKYLRPEVYKDFIENGKMGNYHGNPDAWTVSWPVERDIPCPSKLQANPEIYPEIANLNHDEFLEAARPQDVYKFGILVKLLDRLTERAFRQILIVRHSPGLEIATHVDSKYKKLHIPLYTNETAEFIFGANKERRYQMQVGKIYIINPSVPHSTENFSDKERVHLLSRIDFDYISEVAKMSGTIA